MKASSSKKEKQLPDWQAPAIFKTSDFFGDSAKDEECADSSKATALDTNDQSEEQVRETFAPSTEGWMSVKDWSTFQAMNWYGTGWIFGIGERIMSDSSKRSAHSADVKSMKMHRAPKSIIPKNCGRSDPHLSRFAPYKLIPFSYTSFCFEIDVAYAITVVGKQWNLTRCLMKK